MWWAHITTNASEKKLELLNHIYSTCHLGYFSVLKIFMQKKCFWMSTPRIFFLLSKKTAKKIKEGKCERSSFQKIKMRENIYNFEKIITHTSIWTRIYIICIYIFPFSEVHYQWKYNYIKLCMQWKRMNGKSFDINNS